MWYDPAQTLSHNCMWNMVLSSRGGGKTFNALVMATKAWLKKKRRFIYLRRSEVELKLCKDHLMNAIAAVGIFPDCKFTVSGTDILCNGEIMGYCIALSKAYQMKSVAYPDVDLIIFDEFLIENEGRYLKQEPHKVIALMETVGRMRDIRLLMLANYVTKSNIYFDFWNLYPKLSSKVTKHPTKPVLIHIWKNDEYREKKGETEFAKMISDTTYGSYVLDNTALLDDYTFVEKPSGQLSYMFTVKFKGKCYGVWRHEKSAMMWFSSTHEGNNPAIMSFDTESHEPNAILMKQRKSNPTVKTMLWAVDHGMIRFENLGVKHAILEMLNYF